jgi:hypothetical protein
MFVLQPLTKHPKNTRAFHRCTNFIVHLADKIPPTLKNKNNSLKDNLDFRSEETKSLHAEVIKELYKDRIAPVKALLIKIKY